MFDLQAKKMFSVVIQLTMVDSIQQKLENKFSTPKVIDFIKNIFNLNLLTV
jgi:hypothetical protein